MSFRTLAFFGVFPALLAAQRPAGVDRQLVAAALWAKARYNYAYWDAVRANWDSAFAATVTLAEQRPAPPDQLLFRRLRRWRARLSQRNGGGGPALALELGAEETDHRAPSAVGNLRFLARAEESVSDPRIHRIRIRLAGCPHCRGGVGKSRVDARVVLGIHPEPLGANLRQICGAGR